MKKILFILFFTIIFTFNIAPADEEIQNYKYFLNNILRYDSDALEMGYDFLEKYKNSSYAPNVLFYLSFVESDYFKNIINLKKNIIDYPDNSYWEDSILSLLQNYKIHGNLTSFKKWYNYYILNSKTHKYRYKIEILYLKILYKYKDEEISTLNNVITNNIENANNYNLLAYSIYIKGLLNNNLNDLWAVYFMFPEADCHEDAIYSIYQNSEGNDKIFISKQLLSTELYNFLLKEEKSKVYEYSKRDSKIKNILVENKYKRSFYYVSIIMVNKKVNYNTKVIDKIKNILNENGFKIYEFTKNNLYVLGVGPFHFKYKAKEVISELQELKVNSNLVKISSKY